MANVTFGRNAPTAYDIRMDRVRAQTNTPSSVPTGRTAPVKPISRVGGAGNLLGVFGTASFLAPVIAAGANAWTGFRKTPQGQLFTDRVGEALSAPARLVNSFTGGRNLLPSSSSAGVRLGQYNPPGFDPSRPVTGADLVQSAEAVSKYFPTASKYFPTASVPSSGAAERAYQSAKAETAAMVATDPLMQQWEKARQNKDYATADQLGKEIWQNRYGGGLMGQPGGVIGSRNPLMERTFGYQTGMSPGDIAKTITNPADIPVSPGEAPYQVGDFGTGVLGDAGYDPVRYGVDVEEIKKRLLQQAAAK